MKKSNNIVLLFLMFLFAQSFGQIKTEMGKENIMNEENIQKVSNIYKEVKTYDYNPQYTLHIGTAANFSFELLINDLPIYKNYRSGIVTGSVPINEAILKKGKQKLTVRMTPPVDKQFNIGTVIDLSLAELKLSINYGEYGKEKVQDFKTAFTYEMPQKKEKLPYYEINLEFDAPVVPYENDVQGWSNSVDLSKEDKDKLLKEVENFYKNMISLYETQNINALAGKYYKRQKEQGQMYFLKKSSDFQNLIDGWIKQTNDQKPFVFDKYILSLYGDGKIVRITNTDKYYLNSSALMREDAEGNFSIYKMFLHRPAPGAPLEVIR